MIAVLIAENEYAPTGDLRTAPTQASAIMVGMVSAEGDALEPVEARDADHACGYYQCGSAGFYSGVGEFGGK